MLNEGPMLEALTHRLAECPQEFLLPPLSTPPAGAIHVPALVADHFRAMGCLPPALSLPIDPPCLSLIAIATWVLRDEWFLSQPQLADLTARLMTEGLRRVAAIVSAEAVVRDPDRREEFIRICLAGLSLRPKGETIEQARDRLTSLDSVAREAIIRDTRGAEARAREVREQMARRAAQEAAAKTTRE